MDPIAIRLDENHGLARAGEPVRIGIPFRQGQLRDCAALALSDKTSDISHSLPVQITPLTHWPDGSVRWAMVQTSIHLQPNQRKTLHLAPQSQKEAATAACAEHAEGWLVKTTAGSILLHKQQLSWQRHGAQHPCITIPSLQDADGEPCTAVAESDWQLTNDGPVFTEASLTGHWQRADGSHLARFNCTLSICLHTGLVDMRLTTHNPKRAKHRGGLWDLGDEGSIHFQSLTVSVATGSEAPAALLADALTDSHPVTAAAITLFQDSSGGDNWQSLNHVDASGEVTTHYRGYQLEANGDLLTGDRANPLLTLADQDLHLQVAMPHFWQNFPSSLSYHNGTVSLGLFPRQPHQRSYELQGGERKTLRCLISYNNPDAQLGWAYAPLTPQLESTIYEQAQAFPWFKAQAPADALDGLLKESLDGPQNFFAKREVIDEYGWRNFGDIFADHETLYQPEGEAPLISHYNNQYDALYGFARQFARTGDSRWFQLMDELAQHVVDIDIYHTEEDRGEYNHGLFWHTDHYLPAHTATHRTFTRHNDTSSTPGQTGGGPAAEHCYTTGLYYHYLLTGHTESRQAVLDLAGWMASSHEGSGGLLEQVLALKKYDIPKLKALLKRQHPTRHRYPFTRGTGNYINALLDAHLLEQGSDWLHRAEVVIEATFHPGDRIAERNLLDVEIGWHYLILLTSLNRYLLLKGELGQYDRHYQYALACFRHYTRWMVLHEEPFLSHPEQLEFANHTWAAQDIRKAMLMYQAACFDPAHKAQYLAKAQEWMDYVASTLNDSPERHYARIQIILLQNYGPHQTSDLTLPEEALKTDQVDGLRQHPPSLSLPALIARISQRLIRGLLNFRPGREKAWLNARLDR
ncbi:MAG: hypothetical protein LAT63_11455 [Marinobacter sp.]|nr:hypothetical protein [Marinobacter sp.]